MKKADVKNYAILKQVPVDYYFKGVEKNPFQKFWHERKWSILKTLLNEGSGKLLDLGCSDGTTTYNISQISPKLKVTGVDLYKEAIVFAKTKYHNIDFVFADAHNLPYKNRGFDYVCAIEILEHLEDPELALKEINRVLKPKGILIIGQDTDNLLFKTIWWFWEKWKGSIWKNSHISCVTPDVLIKRVKKSGFKVEKVMFVSFGMEVFIKAKKV